MEALKQLALMLVFCAAAGFIYYFLLPSGKISQTAKSVMSVFFLLCVLSPLFSFLGQELPSFGSAQPEAFPAYDEAFAEAAKRSVLAEADRVISQYTEIPYEISVDVHISDGDIINIEQIGIMFDEAPADPGGLAQALREALGAIPVITVREGE